VKARQPGGFPEKTLRSQIKADHEDCRNNQRTPILRILIAARGGWVPLPEIMACAAQYNARIHELRRRGFPIESRVERIDGVTHSWFRLVSNPKGTVGDSIKPETPEPAWKDRPRVKGLPLFGLAVRW
jgi:hypothetical protein